MAIFKRGDVYWFNFWWNGQHVQRSTRQGNPRVARQMEAAHRTALAKGEVGIEARAPVPTLRQFTDHDFKPWVKATFAAKRKTRDWYSNGINRLSEFEPIAGAPLDRITGEKIAAYVAHRQARSLTVTSINRELQVLRRMLRLGVEWGRAPTATKVRMLPGERRRERVLSLDEDTRYLNAAAPLLRSVATVLIDSGMRPEECFRLQWEHVNFEGGRHGSMLVPHGKTPAARRLIPMTPRVRSVLVTRWLGAGRPSEGWIFPAPTRSGHVEPSTLKKQHARALKESGVRPFVFYTLRHTFLTRLGESGCDVWTLARIAGHSSVTISSRYVHPGEDAVLRAFERVNGHGKPADQDQVAAPAAQPALPAAAEVM